MAATPAGAPPWLAALLDGIDAPPDGVRRLRTDHSHSNDIHELTFGDGRVLLVKAARHEWVRPFFAASAAAARLVSTGSDVIVPQPLRVPDVDVPLQAYWRIPLPTLAGLWPRLEAGERKAALRSLGGLVRRLHTLEAPGWGPLHRDRPGDDVADELDRDLRRRLLPATIAHWPAGIPHLERLISLVPAVTRSAGPRRPVVVHTDLHLGNVLCRVGQAGVECVGLLDLDEAAGGLAEADLACLDVLHGPLFERHIDPVLRREVRAGYGGAAINEALVDFHRCAHLANQGFSSGLLGHHEHAAAIADQLGAELALLEGGPPLRLDRAGGRHVRAAARYWP